MAEHEHRDQRHADGPAQTAPGARASVDADRERDTPEREAAVDRVVNDVKEGVDRVAEKVKGLLRSNR